MADSNITKKALATSLKSLMDEKAFEKISIADICERCEMNRKSFYYHFKDKYDLVNWIFDTEFIAVARKKNYGRTDEVLKDICAYFYENRSFYRKALCIEGQNSFSDHFRELLYLIFSSQLDDIIGISLIKEFQINFFVDAIIMTFQRWITEYTTMTPAEFMEQMEECIKYITVKYGELEEKQRTEEK